MVFEIQLRKKDVIIESVGKRWNILPELLAGFSRDELRRIAVWVGVPRGRDKNDTIRNLSESESLFKNANIYFGIDV